MKFIKIFPFLLLSLMIGTLTSAQVIGLKLGVNSASLDMDHESISPFKHKTVGAVNLHGGLTVDIKINNLITIEPGFLFTKKTMRYEDGVPNTDFFYQSEYALTYLNIPLPIKFNFKSGDITYFAFAGGYLDLGMKGELTIKQEIGAIQTLEDYDTWPKTKEERRLEKVDYGTTFGVGLIVSDIQFELFSNLGFVDLATEFDSVTTAKNRNFGISLTLRLGSNDSDFD